jgi:hypothetical protein
LSRAPFPQAMFTAFLAADRAKWKKLIGAANIRAE